MVKTKEITIKIIQTESIFLAVVVGSCKSTANKGYHVDGADDMIEDYGEVLYDIKGKTKKQKEAFVLKRLSLRKEVVEFTHTENHSLPAEDYDFKKVPPIYLAEGGGIDLSCSDIEEFFEKYLSSWDKESSKHCYVWVTRTIELSDIFYDRAEKIFQELKLKEEDEKESD